MKNRFFLFQSQLQKSWLPFIDVSLAGIRMRRFPTTKVEESIFGSILACKFEVAQVALNRSKSWSWFLATYPIRWISQTGEPYNSLWFTGKSRHPEWHTSPPKTLQMKKWKHNGEYIWQQSFSIFPFFFFFWQCYVDNKNNTSDNTIFTIWFFCLSIPQWFFLHFLQIKRNSSGLFLVNSGMQKWSKSKVSMVKWANLTH